METTQPTRGRPRCCPDGRRNLTISVPADTLRRVRATLPAGEISRAAVAGLVAACEEREQGER